MTPQELEVIALSTAKLVKAAVTEAQVPLLARIADLEARQLIPGPEGPQGPQGDAGADGLHGKDGRDGIDGKDGSAGLPGERGEKGMDGAPGRDGRDGAIGAPGRDGERGEKGIDGTHGKDGRDGIDGLGFDDLSADFDGQRTVTLRFQQGDRVKTFPINLQTPIYRDVFAEGASYDAGDMVTWGGSVWIAKETTTDKPGTTKAWQLAVKRGRDGKEGKAIVGPAGPPGPKGDPGRYA